MPIYEYRCENGHLFEVMQKIADPPVTACETCAAPVQRVFHPIAVHFKGSGFYNTDYGKAKNNKGSKDGKADSSESGSGSDSKSDSSSSSDSKPSDSKSSDKSDSKTSKASASSSSDS